MVPWQYPGEAQHIANIVGDNQGQDGCGTRFECKITGPGGEEAVEIAEAIGQVFLRSSIKGQAAAQLDIATRERPGRTTRNAPDHERWTERQHRPLDQRVGKNFAIV
jgi:hypothetical protein